MSEKPIRIEADSLRGLAELLLAEARTAAEDAYDRAVADGESPLDAAIGYSNARRFLDGPHRASLEACLETALENVSDAQEAERAVEEGDPDEGWEPAPQYGVPPSCPRCGGVRDRDPGGEVYCTECGR